MDQLFNLNECNTKNYYEILGCDQRSSIEQINAEFKVKALSCHPDKNNHERASDEFKILLEAKETLSDSKMREKYDMWLNSGLCVSWKDWLNRISKNNTVFHWVIPKTDPMLTDANEKETRFPTQNVEKSDLQGFRCNASPHASNDVLSKFRNYQI